MKSASERRAPGATRIPFDGMVEVGGSLGPAFEAQAVDLSEEGMKIRTAYVPDIGQPITCRFDAGQGLTVVAAGEVLWKEDLGDGGEFGIRFTNLDGHSTVSLQRIMGLAEEGVLPRPPQGRKIRLHIDGLASPMRARLRASGAGCATAYSELGFLEMGKPLDLEDALSGARRPALIDRVDVAVDEGSRIPQLVVTLRYDDEEAHVARDEVEAAGAAVGGSLAGITIDDPTPHDDLPETAAADEDEDDEEPAEMVPAESAAAKTIASESENLDGIDDEAMNMKGRLARTAARITPAVTQWAKRAKTTMTLLAAKAAARRGGSGDDVEIPVRRTTAPAPGGGLHTAGRKVVRGAIGEDRAEESAPKPRIQITKRRAAIGGAIGLATILAVFALRTPDAPPPLASAPPAVETAPPAPEVEEAAEPLAPPEDPLAAAATNNGRSGTPSTSRVRIGRPTPFTNGSVGSSGNVIRIKMDGEIESILGASQPTGFTVVIPNRHSMDAAGPLARKDPRIAALRMANEDDGAELTVTFKDGVPPYAVRARGDVLEMVLAKASSNGDRAAAAKATPRTTTKKRQRRKR